MNWLDSATVTISVTGLDLIALKKLSLVSHALAEKIGGGAGREQTTLAGVLDEVTRKLELAAAKPPSADPGPVALPGYAFCVQGRDGSGYKVSYGFETAEQGHAFHDAVIAAQKAGAA